MVSAESFIKLALSFPDVAQQPHFEKQAFKLKGRRIFCTLSEKDKHVTVRLPVVEQSVYCDVDGETIYAVPNKWGKQGWTHVSLPKIKPALLKEILKCAYEFAK